MANYNLFDAASLAMVPTGIKDGKLYSVKPNDGAGDFTFSRGTNLTATRVNADGLIEKGRENHILHSNAFNDASWNKTDLNATSGVTDPNGGSTAWTIANTAANGIIQQAVTFTGLRSVSIYAKQGTHRYLRMGIYGGTSSYANFDLQDGVVSSGTKATIQDIGGGWYRCTAWGADGTTGGVQIYPSNSSTGAPTTNGSIEIWRCQLESGLVATDYIETTTAPVSAGITENLPRIDYSGGCGSLLLEPQRVNLVTQSELVTTSITNVGYTASENDATSPEGVVNAGKILETTGTTHLVQKTFSVASTTASYAVSFFVKGIGRTRGTISYELNGAPYNSVSATFNLAEETITDAVASGTGAVAGETDIIPMGNDWYRITLSGVVGIAGTHFVRLFGRDDSGNTSYVGDPTKGFNVYGFQAELGSYPTSYIPTYGSAATRTVEYPLVNPQNLLGATEGSWFVNFSDMSFDISGTSGSSVHIGYNQSNYLGIANRSLGNVNQVLFIKRESGAITNLHTITSQSGDDKFCFTWKDSSLKLFVNGVKVYEDNGFANFIVWDELVLGNTARVPQYNNKQTLLFPTQLTDNECKALTRPYDTYQEWVDGEGLTWESKSCTVQNIVELQNL